MQRDLLYGRQKGRDALPDGFVQQVDRPDQRLLFRRKMQEVRNGVLPLQMQGIANVCRKLCHQPAIQAVGPCLRDPYPRGWR